MTELPKNFYYKNNRLQQLRGFYYTVLLGSITKAAEHMNLNISAVSMQIDSLKRDLKTNLFRRKGRNIEPTPEGRELYKLVQPLVEGLDSVFDNFFIRSSQAQSNQVKISTINNSIHYFLPEIVGAYRKTHPQAEIKIHNVSREEAYIMLKQNEVDLYAGAIADIPPDFEYTEIMISPVVLVVRKNHPLCKFKKVKLEQLKKYELIRLDPKYAIIPAFEENVKFYNYARKIRLINSDWQILKNFVRETDGFTMTAAIAVKPHDKGLATISLGNYFPPIKYGILTKKGRSLPANVREFITTAKLEFVRDQ